METQEQFYSGSGIPIKGIYTPADINDIDYNKDLGLAGEPPFTRGVYANMYRGKLWTIRRFSGVNTPEATNKLYRQEYELGQTGISVAFDIPTSTGLDSDDPRVFFDVGGDGVPASSIKEMEIIFEGLPIDQISTSLQAGAWAQLPLTAMYFTVVQMRGLDMMKLRGTSLEDPGGTGAVLPQLDGMPPYVAFKLTADLVEWCADHAPKWHPVCFDSYPHREQGISAVQELGELMAEGIQLIEEEKQRGRISLDKFVRRFAFNMGIHNDFFEEIAKLRAGRRMWYKITKERYGIQDPACWQFRLHVQSSGCTHTTQEPLNNLIRIAYQMLAATLGGAQSMHANGYDEGVCIPTEQSMLLSIRTEQILQHETNIINTVDPLGGSWYIEWLTNEVERKTWEYIQKIEDKGGMSEAINTGWIHREYRQAMIEHERKLSTGEITVVGVNKFRLEKEPYETPIYRSDPKAPEQQIEKLKQFKKKRDNAKVDNLLQKLEEVSRRGDNVMPAVMEAVKNYATVGEIADVWRKVYGIWPSPMGI